MYSHKAITIDWHSRKQQYRYAYRLTHAQTKEIANAPDISIIEISHQNNVGAANPNNAGTDNASASEIVGRSEIPAPNQDRLPQHTKTPKSHVPCPFLRRKGYCLKGSKCDFSHANPLHSPTLYKKALYKHSSCVKSSLIIF